MAEANFNELLWNELHPLFIPLKGEFYDQFVEGLKQTEFRRYGKRWNERTCALGRPVVLSRGYGKAHRTTGRVVRFDKSVVPSRSDAYRACYGNTGDEDVACIRIQLDSSNNSTSAHKGA